MNFRLLSILGFIFFFSTTTHGDVTPRINAVCKITLSNGNVVEGFIALTGQCDMFTNGFYFESYYRTYKYEKAEFFTLDFKSLYKKDSSYYIDDKSTYANCRKFMFLKQVDCSGAGQQLFHDNRGANDTISIRTNINREYLALDSMDIFFEMTSYTSLDPVDENSKKVISFKRIAVNEIIKFELLAKPSEKWLKIISESNIKAEQLYNGPEGTGDFAVAFWYHEALTNKDFYNNYQPRIIFNIER